MKAVAMLEAAIRLKYKKNVSAAKALGCSQAYLSDVFNGRRRLSAELACKAEQVLGEVGLATRILYAQVNDDIEGMGK
jgi:transcriptional regulator with XRE-family HTH domain